MRRCLSLSLLLLCVIPVSAADEKTPPEGVLPSVNGRKLNLDFETGTLQDWTAEGEAFKDQPIKGDTVKARRADNRSEHQGQYWIGGYEKHQDKPQGTLTSVPFKVTHPWASLLVGGGPHDTTCVEIVRKDTGKVIGRFSGLEEENLKRVAIDLTEHKDKEIFIRVVDKHNGHWGHINFDDFRFHAEKPKVPARAPAVLDTFKHAGLEPVKAAAAMTVPEGFKVTLFAGEPDIVQPIAMCLDDRGRVWVAEAYSYPIRRPEKEAKDRILIFEDTDGDGKFDKRTVFMEGLNLVSGIEVGFGGVWIGAAPELLFVPMKPGEDKPSGPAKVLLDGWGYRDTHETLNSFIWGPDGWLYGCHGVFTYSKVGKPGTADKDRVDINAGIWRYHPTRHTFEVFAHGTSNPWGFDFNDWGQAFCEACVIPHNWHIIQGGRYQRQAGQHFNPHTYADIQTIAEHRHYVGATPHGGNNKSDSVGGGHAHCGTMIYLGGTWPEEYRNQMFMGNIHGRRLNIDTLKPKGSGYTASYHPDFLLANDAWARFINLRYGPDGNVYMIDWYDKQACHHTDPKIWDRGNGRIYKISYKNTKPVKVDLNKLSDEELVKLQLDSNDWYVRHSRRILQERGVKPEIHEQLKKIAFDHKDETRRLRGLWALHVTGGLDDKAIEKGFKDSSPYVRAWTIQVVLEQSHPRVPGSLSWEHRRHLLELARKDPSPIVRLYLASGLPRMYEGPNEVLSALLAHSEDAADHNIPLLLWYAAEPCAELDPEKALKMTAEGKFPQVHAFMARRIAALATPESTALLVQHINKTDDATMQLTYVRALQEGLKGRKAVAMPKEWPDAYVKLGRSNNADVRSGAQALAVTFGDTKAFAELRKVLVAKDADVAVRKQALAALVAARDKDLAPMLQELVKEPALRGPAIQGLAVYDDAKTPEVLLANYASFSLEEKRDALNTLASRAAYAKPLLDAIGNKKVPANEVPAEVVRQMRNLNDKAIDTRIGEVWGIVRTTPEDRLKFIAQYRNKLSEPGAPPDLALGRAMFQKTCAQCHTLYGVGSKIGPDITGSNRASLDYLLENIFDPSAVIPKEYATTVINLKKGRVITGIVRGETPAAITIQTANESLTVPKDEIDERTPGTNSMMPDDLLKTFKEDEIRALFAYLKHPTQTPILALADTTKDFFNGKDLTGWDGDKDLWSVDNGEIVGKSPGLKRNEFLKSHMLAGDFRLTLKVKLTPNKENSGIQFRSEPLKDGEMKGPQADAGAGWWGKLYEENGRGLLWKESGEKHVKEGDWNEYVIEAKGSKVKTWINGQLCVDLEDEQLAKRGIFAFQLHSGGALEVRYKDLKLELLSK